MPKKPGITEPVKQSKTFLVLIRKTSGGWKTFREDLSADQSNFDGLMCLGRFFGSEIVIMEIS
jgi:hypothetical protein